MNYEQVILSQKQIDILSNGKKHWTLKTDFLLKRIKNFGYVLDIEQLKYFMEVIIVRERARIKKQFFLDSLSGKRINHLTPTDIKGNFTAVVSPTIGIKYHIGWAHSGAVFQLARIENGICFMDNPKNRRTVLLECTIKDLRNLR